MSYTVWYGYIFDRAADDAERDKILGLEQIEMKRLNRAYVIISSNPFVLTMSIAFSAISLACTAITRFAPDLAAKRDKMPVPQPSSSTIASLKRIGLVMM